MKALLQRVSSASVVVDNKNVAEIAQGLLVFIGIMQGDSELQADKLLHKIFNYRIFSDSQQRMNLSVKDVCGGVLFVSQFTLAADTRKGLRPGFSVAADPDQAKILYQYLIEQADLFSKSSNNTVRSGIFGADMKVSLLNDGPVTFLLEV